MPDQGQIFRSPSDCIDVQERPPCHILDANLAELDITMLVPAIAN